MLTLLLVFVFLAAFHFAYDGILLPSLRDRFQSKLYGLRDDVRRLKMTQSDRLDSFSYNYLQSLLNNAINIVPHIGVTMLYTSSKFFTQNTNLKKKAVDSINRIEAYQDEEIKRIRREAVRVLDRAFFVNTLALMLYLLPIAVAVAAMIKIKDIIKNNIDSLVSVPENDLEKIIPQNAL